jgi:hypothetical protein
MIFSRSTLGVAKGRCGVDLMCLPLGATTETVESPGANYSLQCTDYHAPSKSIFICRSILGKCFQSIPRQ